MTEAALETVGLGRRYGRRWALRECSLTVPEGSITGLVGPNGAGKSTLLRLAAGIARPTAGVVRIFGKSVRTNGIAHLSRIGYFDQLRPLYGNLRVEDILTLGKKLNAGWNEAAAIGWLSESSIAREERIDRLSLGQQALVALTLCIGKSPDLLLLDEPVANLDPLARRQLLEMLLASVAERGTTVFVSSHIVSELEPICDHLIILSASNVRIAGSVEWLLASHRILIGPRGEEVPEGVRVISLRDAGRQSTFVVRGDVGSIGPAWRVLEPDLEEIVLAYLSAARADVPPSHDPSGLSEEGHS